MVLSRQNKLYDVIRNKWVVATPEEQVRQHWIHYMIHELHYPKNQIVIEKSLSELSFFSQYSAVPNRRFDLICYTIKDKMMIPLLLMEFKAVSLNQSALNQIIGYNYYFQSQFVCIANDHQVITGVYLSGKYEFLDYLPAYPKLMDWKRDD